MKHWIRPVSLMVVMAMLTVIPVFAGLLDAFYDGMGLRFSAAVGSYLKSIPDSMWDMGSIIFVGYAGARSFDKHVEAKAAQGDEPGEGR